MTWKSFKGNGVQANVGETSIDNVRKHLLEDSVSDATFAMQIKDDCAGNTKVSISEKSQEICSKIIADLQ